jgi:hypothetical protein
MQLSPWTSVLTERLGGSATMDAFMAGDDMADC